MLEFNDINFYLRKNFETVDDLDYYGDKIFRVVGTLSDNVELKPENANYDDEEYPNIHVSNEELDKDFYSFGEFLATAVDVNRYDVFKTIPECKDEGVPSKIKYMDERYCLLYNDELKRHLLEINPSFQMKVFEKVLERSNSTR